MSEQKINSLLTSQNDIGCSFEIFRHRKRDKIISISVWKSSGNYVFNLSNTIVQWGTLAKTLYPDWNVRFYIDNSIFNHVENDIVIVDWNDILIQLKKHKNIEIYKYFCDWGFDESKKGHKGTFGSLVRFHVLTDSEVNVSIIKNVELLSTPKDARLVHHFVNSDKKYLTYFDPNYVCDYGKSTMCEIVEKYNYGMILATFGMKGECPVKNLFHKINKLIFKYPELNKFKYGVDEIILTYFIKPKMTVDNVYMVPRDHFIPLQGYYIFAGKILMDFFNNPITYNEEQKIILEENKGEDYDPLVQIDVTDIPIILRKLYRNYPDMFALAIQFLRKKIYSWLRENRVSKKEIEETRNRLLDHYLFAFIQNDEKMDDPLNFVSDEREAYITLYCWIQSAIFEYIDWKGYVVKHKGDTIKAELTKENISIFARNIKNIYLSDDIDYEN